MSAGVPTGATCTLAIDSGITDTGGVRIETGSSFELRVADLGLVSVAPYNDSDAVLAPTGAVQFVFNADLDEATLGGMDFQLVRAGSDVAVDVDVPGAADTVIVFGDSVLAPGSYTASIRSSALISEINGGGFVFDPAGTNTFAFTVNDTVMTGLEVTTADPSVPLGVPVQFTAMATLSDGTSTDVTSMATWSVDDTSIATISNAMGTRGQVTSLLEGSVTITAMLGTLTDTAGLTIEPAALLSIDVTPATATIPAGLDQPFLATGTFSDGSALDITSTVTWSTSNASIATIDATGLATTAGGTQLGPVTITAMQGTLSDTAVLTVSPAVLASIEVTCAALDIPLGVDVQCQAMGTFSDGVITDITGTVTWTATPATRVSVTSTGLVTTPAGATAGPATITATSGLVSDSFALDVTDAVLTGVTITNADGWSIPIGTDLPFFAQGTFSDGSSCTVGMTCDVSLVATWSATPAGRIAIDATGLATAPTTATTGAATITATLGAFSDTSVGMVAPAALQTIVVSPDNVSLPVGATQQYQAMGTFSDGQQLDITALATWSTSNGSFATVSSSGLVTMVAPGPVSVIATRGMVTDSASLTVISSAPEIAVEIAAAPLADPGVDRVGNRIVGVPFTRTYTVRNTGSANLTLGAITFPSSTNCTANLQTPPGTTTIAPTTSTTFSVQVTPTATGTFSCKVAIANNDSDENPYDLDVHGVGVLDTGNFAAADGIYDGDNGCGMGTFTLSSDLAIVLANLAGNAPLTFLLTAAATASASGVVVFSIGNHTCTITRIGTSFTISMSCSNTSGGSCFESFSRRTAPEISVSEVATGEPLFSGNHEYLYALLPTSVIRVDWDLRITNDGTAPLNLGAITFTNDINCNGTLVTAPGTSTLAPGASTTLTVRATPIATGPFLCTVRIPSNDSDENPFVLGMPGQAF
ncbi:MAG: Ig-like domain-containing protein [Myxococcales bacterium]|nr:Ig-like domain-containing protein [Myxococcales bacterium]